MNIFQIWTDDVNPNSSRLLNSLTNAYWWLTVSWLKTTHREQRFWSCWSLEKTKSNASIICYYFWDLCCLLIQSCSPDEDEKIDQVGFKVRRTESKQRYGPPNECFRRSQCLEKISFSFNQAKNAAKEFWCERQSRVGRRLLDMYARKTTKKNWMPFLSEIDGICVIYLKQCLGQTNLFCNYTLQS